MDAIKDQVQGAIDDLRADGYAPDAGMVANVVVPDGSLPDSHPDYLSDRDPWSVVWDIAYAILNN